MVKLSFLVDSSSMLFPFSQVMKPEIFFPWAANMKCPLNASKHPRNRAAAGLPFILRSYQRSSSQRASNTGDRQETERRSPKYVRNTGVLILDRRW